MKLTFLFIHKYAGWGDIDGFYHNRTDVLLQLQIPVVDTERCRQQVKQILNPPRVDAQINDRVICARLAGDKGVWKGDSFKVKAVYLLNYIAISISCS